MTRQVPLWMALLTTATGIVVGFAIGVNVVAGRTPPPDAAPSTSVAEKTLAQRVSDCRLPASAVLDGGNSLSLDTPGSDSNSGDVTIEDLLCALTELDTPQSTIKHMEQTRAMDGRQEQTIGDLRYSWAYHPDRGLDVLVTKADL